MEKSKPAKTNIEILVENILFIILKNFYFT